MPTDVNEQFLATARKAANLYLDSFEKTAGRAIDFELKLAGMTRQEWLKDLIEAQSSVARDFTQSYTATARSFLE